jgi:hypothetical protein
MISMRMMAAAFFILAGILPLMGYGGLKSLVAILLANMWWVGSIVVDEVRGR